MTINVHDPQQGAVVLNLTNLHAGTKPPNSPADIASNNRKLNAYLAALVEARWPKRTLGEIMGVSHQAVGQRVNRANEGGVTVDLGDLPVPPPPPSRRILPPTRTMSGMRVPDVRRIQDAEAARTQEQIAALHGTPLENLEAVGRIIDDAEAKLAELEQERAKLAWSMTCYDRRRDLTKAGLWEARLFHEARDAALGIGAEELAALSDEDLIALAKKRRIWRQKDAENRYYDVASGIAATKATRDTALRIRNELLVAGIAAGHFTTWTAAAAINRNPSVVWQAVRSAELQERS